MVFVIAKVSVWLPPWVFVAAGASFKPAVRHEVGPPLVVVGGATVGNGKGSMVVVTRPPDATVVTLPAETWPGTVVGATVVPVTSPLVVVSSPWAELAAGPCPPPPLQPVAITKAASITATVPRDPLPRRQLRACELAAGRQDEQFWIKWTSGRRAGCGAY